MSDDGTLEGWSVGVKTADNGFCIRPIQTHKLCHYSQIT